MTTSVACHHFTTCHVQHLKFWEQKIERVSWPQMGSLFSKRSFWGLHGFPKWLNWPILAQKAPISGCLPSQLLCLIAVTFVDTTFAWATVWRIKWTLSGSDKSVEAQQANKPAWQSECWWNCGEMMREQLHGVRRVDVRWHEFGWSTELQCHCDVTCFASMLFMMEFTNSCTSCRCWLCRKLDARTGAGSASIH